MQRRNFLKLMPVAAGVALITGCSEPAGTGGKLRRLEFYVAGGRFYKMYGSVEEGQVVHVFREALDGEICYGIHSTTGQRIGYVPKEMVSILEGCQIHDAKVVSTRRFGVPWRRCRVGITVG